MRLKLLIFSLVVVVCHCAFTSRNKKISIDEEGSRMEITTEDGKRIKIERGREGAEGRKNIDIEVSGPGIRTKTVRVNDDERGYSNSYDESDFSRYKRSSRRSKTQGDILSEVCREYMGINDEKQFEKFLKKLEKAVDKGEIDNVVLQSLKCLDSGDCQECLNLPEAISELGPLKQRDTLEPLRMRQEFEGGKNPFSRLGEYDLELQKSRLPQKNDHNILGNLDIEPGEKNRGRAQHKEALEDLILERELDAQNTQTRVPLTRKPFSYLGRMLRRPFTQDDADIVSVPASEYRLDSSRQYDDLAARVRYGLTGDIRDYDSVGNRLLDARRYPSNDQRVLADKRDLLLGLRYPIYAKPALSDILRTQQKDMIPLAEWRYQIQDRRLPEQFLNRVDGLRFKENLARGAFNQQYLPYETLRFYPGYSRQPEQFFRSVY